MTLVITSIRNDSYRQTNAFVIGQEKQLSACCFFLTNHKLSAPGLHFIMTLLHYWIFTR